MICARDYHNYMTLPRIRSTGSTIRALVTQQTIVLCKNEKVVFVAIVYYYLISCYRQH
jgi:hypothetical protein